MTKLLSTYRTELKDLNCWVYCQHCHLWVTIFVPNGKWRGQKYMKGDTFSTFVREKTASLWRLMDNLHPSAFEVHMLQNFPRHKAMSALNQNSPIYHFSCPCSMFMKCMFCYEWFRLRLLYIDGDKRWGLFPAIFNKLSSPEFVFQ